MKFTVVIPTFNRRQQIGGAIESALAQQDVDAGVDVEVVVVDDGSTDGTAEWLAEAYAGRPLRVLPNRRAKGPGGARNTGMLAAQGDAIALLDSDDAFIEGHLADARRAFETFAEVDVVFGRATYERNGQAIEYMGPNFERKLAAAPVTRRTSEVRVFGPAYFEHLLVNGCYFSLGTVVMRPPAARALMNESLRIAEDYEFWVRLARTHRFACLERPQARYILHDANITYETAESAAQHAPSQLAAYHIIRAYPGLERRQRRIVEEHIADVLFGWAYRCRQRLHLREAAQLHLRSMRYGKRPQNMAALLKLLLLGLFPRLRAVSS